MYGFNKCINKSCTNCVKHSNDISQLFSKLKINKEYKLIQIKFNELHKYKLEYDEIVTYHNKIKLINCNKTIELFKLILKHEQPNLKKLLVQLNDNTIHDFKMFLQDNIYKFNQHNYIIE